MSTGESEFHALVKGASAGIGYKTLMADFGIVGVEVELQCDATAGKGIAERRGVGRVRHLRTPLLWAQRAVQRGHLKITKIAGAENCADMGATHIEAVLIAKFFGKINFE